MVGGYRIYEGEFGLGRHGGGGFLVRIPKDLKNLVNLEKYWDDGNRTIRGSFTESVFGINPKPFEPPASLRFNLRSLKEYMGDRDPSKVLEIALLASATYGTNEILVTTETASESRVVDEVGGRLGDSPITHSMDDDRKCHIFKWNEGKESLDYYGIAIAMMGEIRKMVSALAKYLERGDPAELSVVDRCEDTIDILWVRGVRMLARGIDSFIFSGSLRGSQALMLDHLYKDLEHVGDKLCHSLGVSLRRDRKSLFPDRSAIKAALDDIAQTFSRLEPYLRQFLKTQDYNISKTDEILSTFSKHHLKEIASLELTGKPELKHLNHDFQSIYGIVRNITAYLFHASPSIISKMAESPRKRRRRTPISKRNRYASTVL
jgi:hypothetical protein